MFFFKSCERQEEMAQLEREREVALKEQEMMERLRAEELLFQQVRPERSVVPGALAVAPLGQCPDTKVQKTPRLWLLRRGFLTSSALCLLCGFFCLMLIFICLSYLAAPGLSCWHGGSSLETCRLLVATCGI